MPILRHELTLIARRQRVTLWRCVYALALVAVAGTTYATLVAEQGLRPRAASVSQLTEGLLAGLFVLQFILAVALAPQWSADAIAGEKERRTLPFLLATPLDSRTIVLGKLAARLAQVAMVLLAGVPVLCALQFFGGLDPALVLFGTAALAATLLSTASVS